MDLARIARTAPVAGAERFFAHGKIILLGEHAVVYGCPALAGALAVGVSVDSRAGVGALSIPAFALTFLPDAANGEQPLGRAYRALRAHLGLPAHSPVDLEATFEVPAGAGLGSSAALGVAVARALLSAHGAQQNEQNVLDAALAWETVIHGRPSGLDHTVAAQSGFGLFVRGEGFSPIRAARAVPLVVGHTGRARDTKGRVSRVAELVAADEKSAQRRFADIARLVHEAREAVECGDLATLGKAMRENQEQLEALDVSCPEIAAMCRLADNAGALGAKLTGGGGGGCVLALAPGREDAVQAAWTRAGFTSFLTSVGGIDDGARA